MATTDLSAPELADYRPAVAEPSDFDSFWADTLNVTAALDIDLQLTATSTPYRTVEIYDASFAGFGGDRIHGWLTRPKLVGGALPGGCRVHRIQRRARSTGYPPALGERRIRSLPGRHQRSGFRLGRWRYDQRSARQRAERAGVHDERNI